MALAHGKFGAFGVPFPLFDWITDCFQFMVGKRKVTVMFKVGKVGLGLKAERLHWVVSLLWHL